MTVTADRHDPWQTPTLEAFGTELAALEQRENEPQRTARARRRLRPWALSGGAAALVAAAVALVLVLESGGTAGATSVINRAPAAAIRSASVSYRTSITVAVGRQTLRRFKQIGEIGFATRAYRAALLISGSATAFEWRNVGGILYGSEQRRFEAGRQQKPWFAVRLTPSENVALLTAPETRAVTDPLSVLRLLRATNARPYFLGTRTLDGVGVRGYEIEMSLASVLRDIAGARHLPASYGATRATFEVWLDRDGRPRRIEESLAATTHGRPLKLTAVIDFSAYGSPVVIRAPAGVEPKGSIGNNRPRPLVGVPTRFFEDLLRAGGG